MFFIMAIFSTNNHLSPYKQISPQLIALFHSNSIPFLSSFLAIWFFLSSACSLRRCQFVLYCVSWRVPSFHSLFQFILCMLLLFLSNHFHRVIHNIAYCVLRIETRVCNQGQFLPHSRKQRWQWPTTPSTKTSGTQTHTSQSLHCPDHGHAPRFLFG